MTDIKAPLKLPMAAKHISRAVKRIRELRQSHQTITVFPVNFDRRELYRSYRYKYLDLIVHYEHEHFNVNPEIKDRYDVIVAIRRHITGIYSIDDLKCILTDIIIRTPSILVVADAIAAVREFKVPLTHSERTLFGSRKHK